MYTVHLRLIGKLIVDFLFVLTELFSQSVTAKALRTNIEIGVFGEVGQFRPNFHVQGDVSINHFCAKANKCLTTLSLTIFT